MSRPNGSKNRVSRPSHQKVPGSATSAASIGVKDGVVDRSSVWVWIRGEGFVRWTEIQQQVAEAYENWRIKKAEQGIRIIDGWEWRADEIERQLQVGRIRAESAARVEEQRLRRLTRHPMDAAEARDLGVVVDVDGERAA